MLATQGTYAPTIFRIRQHGLRRGGDPHICPWYRLILIEEGGLDIDHCGITITAKDGDVCLLPPNEAITLTRQPSMRSIWLGFTVMARKHPPIRGRSPRFDRPECSPQEIWGCDLPVVQEPETSGLVSDIIRIIAATAWTSELDRLSGNQRLSYVLECLVRARLGKQNTADPEVPDHAIARVHTIITSQLASLHTAKDIAVRLGISVSALDKSYRKATGEAPMSFLRRYRLAETARLLQNSQLSLSRIAEAVGFRNSKALYKAWTKAHGVPPRQWRLQHLHQAIDS